MRGLVATGRAGRSALLLAALAGGLMAGGACRPARAEAVSVPYGVPLSPNAHLYDYFIINGMARGAYLVGKLRSDRMPALIQMDDIVRKAALRSLDSQAIRSDFKADQLLTRYLGMIPH